MVLSGKGYRRSVENIKVLEISEEGDERMEMLIKNANVLVKRDGNVYLNFLEQH